MPSLGFAEILLIGIILIIVVGPQRLPHATRFLGRTYGMLRRSADELRRALVLEADRMDEEDRLRGLAKRREAADARRRQQAAEATGDEPVPQVADAPEPEPEPEAEPPELDDDADPVTPTIVPADEVDISQPAPGFSAEQWEELPEDVRRVVSRRRGS